MAERPDGPRRPRRAGPPSSPWRGLAVAIVGLALALACALVAGLVPLPGWAVAVLWSLTALALAAVTGAAVWVMLGVLDGIWLVGMLAVELTIAGLLVLFVKAPDFYPNPRLQPVPDVMLQAARETAYGSSVASLRTAALAVLVGLAALGTLAVNAINSRLSLRELRQTAEDARKGRWQTAKDARQSRRQTAADARQSRRQTAEDARQSRRLTAQGQVADRYAKPVELLGADNLTVRTGGIYVLQQLADGAERGDRDTVRGVLTAFVRVAVAGRTPAPGSPGPVGPNTPAAASAWPPDDVRAALGVLPGFRSWGDHLVLGSLA